MEYRIGWSGFQCQDSARTVQYDEANDRTNHQVWVGRARPRNQRAGDDNANVREHIVGRKNPARLALLQKS